MNDLDNLENLLYDEEDDEGNSSNDE